MPLCSVYPHWLHLPWEGNRCGWDGNWQTDLTCVDGPLPEVSHARRPLAVTAVDPLRPDPGDSWRICGKLSTKITTISRSVDSSKQNESLNLTCPFVQCYIGTLNLEGTCQHSTVMSSPRLCWESGCVLSGKPLACSEHPFLPFPNLRQ